MAAVSVERMRELERLAMAAGVNEAELMEKAGTALGRAIGRQYGQVGFAVGYLGKGHNAGDALIALRVLRDEFGWRIGARAAYSRDEWADLTSMQWEVAGLEVFLDAGYEREYFGTLLLVDGLLGIGTKGPLKGELAFMAAEIDEIRERRGAVVVAVDNPSGVDPDTGNIYEGAVVADRTFMIGAAKRGLLLGKAANAVGGVALVTVEGLCDQGEGDSVMICPQQMDFGKNPREFDFHKGKAGKLGIVAGSLEYSGAGLISGLGGIRAGAGLVTIYARSEACDAMRARLPFEVMLRVCDEPTELLGENIDAWVVGPGLGTMTDMFETGLLEFLGKAKQPIVVDADGLNLMARVGFSPDQRHVLTPHAGEFARLAADLRGVERERACREYAERVSSVLLLKGARTLVCQRGRPLRVNSTGGPAMSNGGQGDLLSGVIGALIAGGMEPYDSASYGAWLCGCAAEMVSGEGDVSVATDVAMMMPHTMQIWRRGER